MKKVCSILLVSLLLLPAVFASASANPDMVTAPVYDQITAELTAIQQAELVAALVQRMVDNGEADVVVIAFDAIAAAFGLSDASLANGATETTSNVISADASMGEQNALRSAGQYLDYSAFSYTGLIEQLEYEGYSNSEAAYAADNCGADWLV